MREQINLTDAQIIETFQMPLLEIEEIEFTAATIEEIRKNKAGFVCPGTTVYSTDTFTHIRGVQPRKGDKRFDLYVADFGQVRGVVKE